MSSRSLQKRTEAIDRAHANLGIDPIIWPQEFYAPVKITMNDVDAVIRKESNFEIHSPIFLSDVFGSLCSLFKFYFAVILLLVMLLGGGVRTFEFIIDGAGTGVGSISSDLQNFQQAQQQAQFPTG